MTPVKFLLDVWSLQAQESCYFFISTKTPYQWQDHALKWPIQKSKLKRFFQKYPKDKYSLYFCPLPFRENKRKRDFVIGSQLLWADLDEVNPRSIELVPQIAWRSSKNRYAALWILNKFHTPQEIEPVNQGLTYSSGADKAGWDLTQVLRIPGTLNLKYKPPQKVELLWFKDNKYKLEKIPTIRTGLDPHEILKQYRDKIKKRTLRLLIKKTVTVGTRSDVIWRLENELHEQGLDKDEIFALIKSSAWNKFAGRKDEDKQLRRELDKVADKHNRPSIAGTKIENINGQIVRLSDVEPEQVEWLWYPYIPRGKVTLIEGDPGLGKSWVTLAIATHLSRRRRLPGSEILIGGKTLIMSAEDGIGDTIRPRLDTMESDPRRIYAFNEPLTLDEEGLENFETQVNEIKPLLVIIDPLVAYMGAAIDLHRANETRELMKYLTFISEKHHTSILAVRHLTKSEKNKSIYRGIGSIDLTAAARSVIMVGRDPHDEDIRVICHIKSNLAPLGDSIRYTIRKGKSKPFKWIGPSKLTAEDIFDPSIEAASKQERKDAIKFVKKLDRKQKYNQEKLTRDAEAKGISEIVLMKILSQYMEKRKRDGKTYWSKIN